MKTPFIFLMNEIWRVLKNDGLFKPEIIQKKWQEHLSGKRNWQYHLWDILMFQAWLNNI